MSQPTLTPEPYVMLAEYNQWMNQRLYALLATLPDELRKRDLGAFFKSIHGTLNHILFGDLAWTGRFGLVEFSPRSADQILFEDFDDLHAERLRVDALILAWAHTLTTEQLVQDFSYTSKIDLITRTRPMWALITHLFNHQTHHRGQITTLLSQQGVDMGITDIPGLPRWV